MSWPRRKEVRREEVRELRADGAAAFEAGRHRQTNPHAHVNSMNRYQWYQGYDTAARAAADREPEPLDFND